MGTGDFAGQTIGFPRIQASSDLYVSTWAFVKQNQSVDFENINRDSKSGHGGGL
jgi:hypothetical protein